MPELRANFEIDRRDLAELESAAQRYVAATQHTAEYTVNKVLQNIAGWSAHYTRKADYDQLRAEMELTYRTTYKKDPSRQLKVPKLDTSAAALRNTVAAARHAARLRLAGKPIPPAAEFYRGVARMIAKTLRSIAFMKSGWLPAFQALRRSQVAAALNESSAFGGRQRPGYGGYVRAALTSTGVSGEIFNTSINPHNHTSEAALLTYGGMGMDAAITEVTGKFNQWADEDFDKNAKIFA